MSPLRRSMTGSPQRGAAPLAHNQTSGTEQRSKPYVNIAAATFGIEIAQK
jgi:hypothetical protein